jgi:hypothetical protein
LHPFDRDTRAQSAGDSSAIPGRDHQVELSPIGRRARQRTNRAAPATANAAKAADDDHGAAAWNPASATSSIEDLFAHGLPGKRRAHRVLPTG